MAVANEALAGAPTLDIEAANRQLADMTAMERINWAVGVYGKRLYALTSAGFDSALTLDHLARSGHGIPIVHIDTGLLPSETQTFRSHLQARYSLAWHSFGPSEEQISELYRTRLWEADPSEYRRQTKLAPLGQAIGELGVGALITGIRSDQTAHRSGLRYVKPGNNGELRIHPFIDWPKDAVETYLSAHHLPRHPLYGHVEFLDDWPLMDGAKTECGLHL